MEGGARVSGPQGRGAISPEAPTRAVEPSEAHEGPASVASRFDLWQRRSLAVDSNQ